MFNATRVRTLGVFALWIGLGYSGASAEEIKTVFVIAMENHNCTQPNNQFTGSIQQIYQKPDAPFINSLVNGTAFAIIDGSVVHISGQVAYATTYHQVLATNWRLQGMTGDAANANDLSDLFDPGAIPKKP